MIQISGVFPQGRTSVFLRICGYVCVIGRKQTKDTKTYALGSSEPVAWCIMVIFHLYTKTRESLSSTSSGVVVFILGSFLLHC